MKNILQAIWDWFGGATAANPGNPAAMPPIPPTLAVPNNNWRGGVLATIFSIFCILPLIYLMCVGIGKVWKDAGIRLPSCGSSAQAQAPAVQQQSVGDTNTTLTEVAKLLASLPPSEMKDNTVMIKGPNSKGEIHGPVTKVYPNARMVPSKVTKGSVTVGGEGTAAVEVQVPLGKSLWFTTPAGIIAEWQDHKGQWGPVPIGETPNQQKVRFTSTKNKPVQFDLLWTDLL